MPLRRTPCLYWSRSDMHGSTLPMTDPVSAQRVEITLSDGRRMLVDGSTALSSVLALVEGMMLSLPL
jgi:transposase